MNHDHIIGGLWVAVVVVTIYGFRLLWQCFVFLSYDEPADGQSWTVGDFKRYFDTLPDDMPVVMLDISTDDEVYMNYHITNEEVAIEDYYRFDSEEYENGIPSGKAVYLHFDNRLNENPIS